MAINPIYQFDPSKIGINNSNNKPVNTKLPTSATTPAISSAEAGINTLEDLMKISGGYSRSDPTLWSINGQKVRIDSKLYQDYCDYWQAWGHSDIYKKYGIKESVQYRDEWTKEYLKNYNAGKVSSLSTQPTTPSQNVINTNQPTISSTATPAQTAWQSNISSLFSNMGWGTPFAQQAWQNALIKPKNIFKY